MTVQRKPDRSDQPSSGEREKRRLSGPLIAASIVFFGSAGTVVYTLALRTEPVEPQQQPEPTLRSTHRKEAVPEPTGQTSHPPHHATSQSENRWRLSEYVGSQTCGDCHSEIAETYSKNPMANTMASVAEASRIEILENDSAEFETHGRRYRVERIGDRMVHTEFMTDSEGRLIYEQAVDVHYAAGSGTNARTYLIDRGGIMFESPITWYTDKQKWDLSPGYHDNPGQRFNRRVSDGCVQCHSGLVAPAGDGASDLFQMQPFPERGIGCERCHGPGQHHVDKMENGDWDDTGDNAEDLAIVNPARLDRRLQESICYQCHMDGETRVLRKGKSFHDFRPGMATEDIWTVFVSSAPLEADGALPFTSQVGQMHVSACFRGSEGRMSCTTCHDPHWSPNREERASFYRQRCNSCHSNHGCSLPIEERELPPAYDSCIHCHMPASESSNIRHTSHSDHRVLRDPGNERDVAEPSGQRPAWSIFDNSDQRMPEWEVHRARALALTDQAAEQRDRQLMRQALTALEAALARDAQDADVLRKLGFLYGAVGNQGRSIESFAAALQVNPYDEMSLKNLGLLASRTGSLNTGLRSYERYLEINIWNGTMFGPYAAMLATSGNMQGAVGAVERGLQLDPTQRELRRLAAQLYARTGDRQKSTQYRRILREISERLDPWDQKRRDRLRKEQQKNRQQDP